MLTHDKSTRRQFLTLAGSAAVLGSVPVVTTGPAEATAATLASAIRNVVGAAVVRTGKVKLDVPPLVENGNAVPMTVSISSPMTSDDYVKSIHVFTAKKPQPAGRQAKDRGDRAAVRRFVLVGQRRRCRHAGGLHGRGDLMTSALINVPARAKRGEIIEIKT